MNIAGFWTGQYAYDNVQGLVVKFHAELSQLGAILSGTTTETNTFADQTGQILIANLFGKVSGGSVDFTKQYTNAAPGQDKILYQGENSKDSRLITGKWTMLSLWTGSFKMSRAIEQPPKKKVIRAKEIDRVT